MIFEITFISIKSTKYWTQDIVCFYFLKKTYNIFLELTKYHSRGIKHKFYLFFFILGEIVM